MRDVACEIVCRELVFRIEPLLLQELCPLGKLWPEAFCKMRVSLGTSQRIDEDQKIAALFDWHLILFGFLAAAVFLSVRQRILSEIVWSEGELPASERGVFEYW